MTDWLRHDRNPRQLAAVPRVLLRWSFPGLLLIVLLPVQSSLAAAEEYQHAVVAADHAAASAAGLRILREGGNVVDAAVATSFALAVVRPASCGVGGGGFMVIWDAEQQQSVALDYRERAPAAATADMFIRPQPADGAEPLSVRGGLACGIPGTVAGLCLANARYGRLPLQQVLQPAIELCEQGVAADPHDREVQRSALGRFGEHADYSQRFQQLRLQYLNGGTAWSEEAVIRSPLGRLLRLIAEQGPQAFYEGPVAAAIARTVQRAGGVMTTADLAGYQPTVRKPLQGQFHGRQIFTMPPPSSGGVAVLQSLQTLEAWERAHGSSLRELGHNSAEYIHVVSEALKHAFADRAEFLGDSDYVDVPLQRLLDVNYAERVAAGIIPGRVHAAKEYGRYFLQPDGGTSHFSVMDAAGNAVACTETINLTFGSFVVVPEYGILLNNEMDDFAAEPGKPNAFGLMQSAQNAVAAGKRPLSSMTPLIAVHKGHAVLSCGASGGPRIITATLQQLLNREVFGMSSAEAVAAARFHHQWFPNELLLEAGIGREQGDKLASWGHQVKRSSGLAAAQGTAATVRDRQKLLLGGSDPRKHGVPAGY